jgi:nitrogen regulatory protein P-II 1
MGRICIESLERASGGSPAPVTRMKKIEAIIPPFRFKQIQEALDEIGVSGLTATDVRGHGRQRGHVEIYRGQEYDTSLRPQIKIEVVVGDRDLEESLAAIIGAARTGRLGDGKIFVTDIAEAIRIRNDNRNESAV